MYSKWGLFFFLFMSFVINSYAHKEFVSSRFTTISYFGLFDVNMNLLDYFFIHFLVTMEILFVIYGVYRFIKYLTYHEPITKYEKYFSGV